jgi:hypothetical protein
VPSRLVVRVLDSSLLIEAERRKLLKELESDLRADKNAITPQRIYDETVTEPASIAYLKSSAARIDRLYKTNAIRIDIPDYTNKQVTEAVDRTRKCIAAKANKPEHLVELADLQIVALAVTHASRGTAVELIFRDNALRDCLEAILPRIGITNLTLVDSSALVQKLLLKRGP